VECTTFRLYGHYFGDPMRYIPVEELEAARAGEPIGRYRTRLIDEGVVDESTVAAIEQRATDEVERAFADALAADPPATSSAITDVYADAAGMPA
jgi:TPP-dependent pyruvate/acetoin dehydrogenase alpha subunit